MLRLQLQGSEPVTICLGDDRSGYDDLSEMLQECEEEQARVLGLVNEGAVLSEYQSSNDADEVGLLGGLQEAYAHSVVCNFLKLSSNCKFVAS